MRRHLKLINDVEQEPVPKVDPQHPLPPKVKGYWVYRTVVEEEVADTAGSTSWCFWGLFVFFFIIILAMFLVYWLVPYPYYYPPPLPPPVKTSEGGQAIPGLGET